MRAKEAPTKKAFTFKINMTKQNLNSCAYWLELLAETTRDKKEELAKLLDTAKELTEIFNRISRGLRKKEKKDEVE